LNENPYRENNQANETFDYNWDEESISLQAKKSLGVKLSKIITLIHLDTKLQKREKALEEQ
jgi:hypothetical protein